MSSSKTTFFLTLVFIASSSAVNAQKVNAEYGSLYDGGTNTASIFSNEAKVGFDSTTKALFALGYFNDGFNISTEASNITDSASLTSFLGNFNVLDSQSFSSATAAGFFGAGNPNVSEQGVGKDSYIMTLGGIESWANGGSASEIGLFRDSSFGTIPAGAEPTPADYNIKSVSYDSVILGKEYLGEALTGAFAGVTGNIYASQAIGQAVPEPSTYALFLGIFSIGFVYWRKRNAKSASQD